MFVVKDDVANVQPVKVARTVGGESVIASGLAGGEMVVTDGQLLLSNGTRVTPREAKVGVLTMTLSETCIRRPVLTTLVTASIIVFGMFRLPAACGRGAAGGGFSDHPDHGDLPGASRGDHGGFGGGADRAAAVDHRRHHLDDVARRRSAARRSPFSSISIATSTAPRSTCRPRWRWPRGGCRWR